MGRGSPITPPIPCFTAEDGLSFPALIWALARCSDAASSWAAFMYNTSCSTLLHRKHQVSVSLRAPTRQGSAYPSTIATVLHRKGTRWYIFNAHVTPKGKVSTWKRMCVLWIQWYTQIKISKISYHQYLQQYNLQGKGNTKDAEPQVLAHVVEPSRAR